jgi:hypothetical protein
MHLLQQSQQKLQTSVEEAQPNLSQQISRYCSSWNQLRQSSQLGQFKTCEICRIINKKAKQQRAQKDQLHNQHMRVPLADAHLQQWVQHAGSFLTFFYRVFNYECSITGKAIEQGGVLKSICLEAIQLPEHHLPIYSPANCNTDL